MNTLLSFVSIFEGTVTYIFEEKVKRLKDFMNT